MSLNKEPAALDVDVAANLAQVNGAIAAAAKAAGRGVDDAALVAVSKTQPATAIEPAIQAGQRIFGENRVQEAQGKWPDLKAAHGDVRLHLIGPLQTNKVRDAVALFDVIETVDRPKLARALAREMEKQDRKLGCFIQVNTGEEPQKAGIMPEETDAFVTLVRDELGLNLRGLMCIPPVEEDCSLHFALLRQIARRNGLSELSMGMSADYEVAIQFGATLVRVGTAIFGARRPL
ncbi:MAG: YggS family pyridoxal phosphate-dependent enzyme [Rhodospirillaceae bacterium]|jgi:PLP dependent protein|nr:YggS family pyridoxal phosphate-dependent enzyme [Rhodospirillaceae bacterium]MBT5192486.1 YggS family pyridoxal phosphate-dependent enzyme [Rhodospirillaceae bacterium]MBT5897515.1 YggS family pyridoxal phosphate-dependent enzyme [Rhodospirillaceae bacterium]MBT7759005.1 YggS family pyridoxal phosphate-dependent enzyme [Rhodospirillaceae bacterium]